MKCSHFTEHRNMCTEWQQVWTFLCGLRIQCQFFFCICEAGSHVFPLFVCQTNNKFWGVDLVQNCGETKKNKGFLYIFCNVWKASELLVFGGLCEPKTQGFIFAHLLENHDESDNSVSSVFHSPLFYNIKRVPKLSHWPSHLFLVSVQVMTCKTFLKSVLVFFKHM